MAHRCAPTGEPDLQSVTVNEGDRLRFTVTVAGAKGIFAIAGGGEDILSSPTDPDRAGDRSYKTTWSRPGTQKYLTVSAAFEFPLAVSYDYEVELLRGQEVRLLKDVTLKCPVSAEGPHYLRLVTKLSE